MPMVETTLPPMRADPLSTAANGGVEVELSRAEIEGRFSTVSFLDL